MKIRAFTITLSCSLPVYVACFLSLDARIIKEPPSSFSSVSSEVDRFSPQQDSVTIAELDATKWDDMCDYLSVQPAGLTNLLSSHQANGVRGVYLMRDVGAGDVILSIPLANCLRDDTPPDWMKTMESSADFEIYQNSNDWAVRLAASYLDLCLASDKLLSSPGIRLWKSLLPDPELLRASLPVHWPEETIRSTRCTAFELSVDSAYFARAQAVQNLLEGMQSVPHFAQLQERERRRLCEDALDLVQTRSCRIIIGQEEEHEEAQDGEWSPPLRLMAPVFDFINHSHEANAEFRLREHRLTVFAKRDMRAGEEVLISYGDSAWPDWKCLVSYGFVPEYKFGQEENNEFHVGEVYIHGKRYEVGPDTIPEDMVLSMVSSTQSQDIDSSQDIDFSPETALRIARRLADAAFYLLLDPKESTMNQEEEEEEYTELPGNVVSSRLAASLRWNQHRILLACSQGLREWADDQNA